MDEFRRRKQRVHPLDPHDVQRGLFHQPPAPTPPLLVVEGPPEPRGIARRRIGGGPVQPAMMPPPQYPPYVKLGVGERPDDLGLVAEGEAWRLLHDATENRRARARAADDKYRLLDLARPEATDERVFDPLLNETAPLCHPSFTSAADGGPPHVPRATARTAGRCCENRKPREATAQPVAAHPRAAS